MIRAGIAFLASILNAVQAWLLYGEGSGVCFNDGCAVVDSLTRVDPLYFNIAGFLYFQTLFWLFLLGYKSVEYGNKLARILLLAGIAAEGVLVFFQYGVAQTFCSYCLVVFGCILLLNVLSGARQIFRAMVIFLSVFVASLSLDYSPGVSPSGSPGPEAGTIASIEGAPGSDGAKRYLFFSSTCPHCEEVLAELRRENSCAIQFNPIERIEGFTFPGAMVRAEYAPEINRQLLTGLGIREIPVMMVVEEERIEIFRGKNAIFAMLERDCRGSIANSLDQVEFSGASSVQEHDFVLDNTPAGDDGCSIDEVCSDGEQKQ